MSEDKGIKGIIVNPLEEVIEAPIDHERSTKITGFKFEKGKKWNPEDAVRWTKGKIHLTDKYRLKEDKESVSVLFPDYTSSDRIVAVNIDRGIYAYLQTASVDDLVENPLKITREILNFILRNKDKSPKEINTLLKDKFNITLHPATIWKVKIGKYPIAKSAGVDSMADNRKEVEMKMRENPLIAELLANPTVPIVKTKWFADLATEMYRKGATADEIARAANEVLDAVRPQYVKLARIKVGKGWTRPRSVSPLTPSKVMRALTGVHHPEKGWIVKPILKLTPDTRKEARMKLLSPAMLRGAAAKVYADTGSKEKALEAALAKLEKGREKRKHKPFESPEAKRLLREFLPTGYRPRKRIVLTEEQKFKRAKRILQSRLDKGYELSPETIEKYGLVRRKKKAKREIDQLVDSIAQEVISPIDVLDEVDVAMLPISEFDELEQVVDALNPLIRMPNIVGALSKFFQQSVGVIPGAWVLNIADRLVGMLTGFIPQPLLKGIIHETLADIGVYALAEALIPYRYEIVKQGIQNVAVAKFWNNIQIGNFKLIPDIFKTKRIKIGVSEQVDYEALESPIEQEEEEVIGYAEVDDIGQEGEEIYLTEEEVAQLTSTSQADLGYTGFAPTTTPHEQPENVSSEEDIETAFLM